MNLENYYWYFESALTPRFCDEVIEYGNSIKKEIALTGDGKEKLEPSPAELTEIKKKRKSNVAWFDDPWLYNEIQPYVHMANQNAKWNFQWDYSDAFQFTEYTPGQFYDWHRDCDITSDLYRKLSVTVQLSDPKDYDGGELQFKNYWGSMQLVTPKDMLKSGTVIVFPSSIMHRVTPITRGTRYSLVQWYNGPDFT